MHSMFHSNLYDPIKRVYMPTTLQNFIDFVKSLILIHKNCYLEIQNKQRDSTSLDWHTTIVNRAKALLPKLNKLNKKLKALL